MTTTTKMADYLISQLSKEEFEKLYRFTKVSYEEVKFLVLKIGKCCNATKSVSFSNANCDLHYAKGIKNGAVHFYFSTFYKKGFDMMKKAFSTDDKYENFDEPFKVALQTLVSFIKNKEMHEKSLIKVLNLKETSDLKETDVVVAMSEHLLGKLCPAESFFIDSGSKRRHFCKCGCNAEIKCGGTGIGNEHVWHGFLDVIFESHGEIVNGASTAKTTRLHLEDEEDSSEEEKDNSDVGVKESFTVDMDNQAAAMAIVFSMLQKNRHPQLDNYLIPFTVISPSHVKIFMYDAENDLLVCCREEMQIFNETERTSLSLNTIITLWMVLNYKYFCSGIDTGKLSICMEDVKSGFAECISACSEHYEALKCCVTSFPVVRKKEFNISIYNSASISGDLDPFPPFGMA